jgi:RimJ/RimL family protein N-acetyltransferase
MPVWIDSDIVGGTSIGESKSDSNITREKDDSRHDLKRISAVLGFDRRTSRIRLIVENQWRLTRLRACGLSILVQPFEAYQRLDRGGPTVTTGDRIRLRPVEPDDLPRMYDLQLDPDSNRVAVTIPRTRESFDAHWSRSLADPMIVARAILYGEAFVGYISCFASDGADRVGYWIDRRYWGLGIASEAVRLLLREVARRPLFATVATGNGASLRVLQKCGFVVERIHIEPASDRYPESEVALLALRDGHLDAG